MIPRINEYNAFAQRVYNIDPLKGGKYRKGQLIPGTNYQILNISRDGTYGRRHECGAVNHMQAMAVAPVDKKGKVDKSQITIAYAGTNFEDSYDRATDMDNIALGLKDLPLNEVTIDSQFTTA
ncbi:MAG: hypothetical protein K2O64_04850 [Lactobacillus sp.]|nr:hypothetical protein [Lactobacillus sp.]